MRRMVMTFVVAVVLLAGGVIAQQKRQQDIDLQAAIRTETVEGDLNGAIKQYSAIVAKYKADRAVTATALVHIAECHHKLGNAEAQVYERVARDFADQKHAADIARTRLGTLTASGGGKTRTESPLTTRKVWSGTAASGQSVDGPIWGLSPDGRYLTFGQLNNLFVRDTASGETRQVTRGGGLVAGSDSDPGQG